VAALGASGLDSWTDQGGPKTQGSRSWFSVSRSASVAPAARKVVSVKLVVSGECRLSSKTS